MIPGWVIKEKFEDLKGKSAVWTFVNLLFVSRLLESRFFAAQHTFSNSHALRFALKDVFFCFSAYG